MDIEDRMFGGVNVLIWLMAGSSGSYFKASGFVTGVDFLCLT
jgi:hypothetical protein